MATENPAVKLYVENIKTIINRQLRPVLRKESLTQIDEAISKILGSKKDISKLPLILRINVGKNFHVRRENEKNVVAVTVHKVSCTCISSLKDTEQELIEEKEPSENTFTVRYHFYLPELLRATCKTTNTKEQKSEHKAKKASKGYRNKNARNRKSR